MRTNVCAFNSPESTDTSETVTGKKPREAQKHTWGVTKAGRGTEKEKAGKDKEKQLGESQHLEGWERGFSRPVCKALVASLGYRL